MKRFLKSYFPRVGGKHYLVKTILPYFPTDVEVYVEPFIGGGSLFLSREKHAPIEVINDIDKDIFDLWNDLPHVSFSDVEKFDWTNNKDTFYDLQRTYFTHPPGRFYRNLYLSCKSFGANRKMYHFSDPKKKKSLCCFKNIEDYKKRLEGVKILNSDFRNVIKEFDSPSTFFYLDPPYSKADKSWGYENLLYREDLLPILKSIKGRFIMSYDYCPDNLELFKDFKIIEIDRNYNMSGGTNTKTTKEILVMNF
jgi:DNA adenine methylase